MEEKARNGTITEEEKSGLNNNAIILKNGNNRKKKDANRVRKMNSEEDK